MLVMRSSRTMLLAGFALLPLAACAPDTETEELDVPAAEEVQAENRLPSDLEDVNDEYLAAWNGNDANALGAFFTEDATATLGDTTFTGRAEIIAAWLEPNVATVSDLEITETRTEPRGTDWYSEGTYRHATTDAAAPDGRATGRYTVTWTRTADGQWRIRSTQITPDAPAPASDTTPQS
ncbi:MAG TPA: nuclear transport factor 2 family protein [Longimicrobiales bacterium]|nr:nuclear transport factor 2 family protein [Longimicrobiales bacterium]